MKKAILIVLAVLGLIGGFWWLERETQEGFRVGLSPDFPPFEYKEREVLKGFDVELARALGGVMQVPVTFEESEFPGLVPALKSGRIAAIISALSPSPEREAHVSYSKPYYRARLCFVHPKGTEAALFFEKPSKRIGVQLGSSMEAYLRHRVEQGSALELKPLADNFVLVQDLLVGRLDAVLLEKAPAQAFVQAHPDKLALSLVPQDPWQDQRLDYAIAFPKNSPWLPRVNAALDTLKENGTLQSLVNRFLEDNE